MADLLNVDPADRARARAVAEQAQLLDLPRVAGCRRLDYGMLPALGRAGELVALAAPSVRARVAAGQRTGSAVPAGETRAYWLVSVPAGPPGVLSPEAQCVAISASAALAAYGWALPTLTVDEQTAARKGETLKRTMAESVRSTTRELVDPRGELPEGDVARAVTRAGADALLFAGKTLAAGLGLLADGANKLLGPVASTLWAAFAPWIVGIVLIAGVAYYVTHRGAA